MLYISVVEIFDHHIEINSDSLLRLAL